MTKSIGLVCNVGVATYGAGVGGIASLGTGRSSYYCLKIVADNNQCSIEGGHMIGVGNDSNVSIVTNLGVSNIICEGDSYVIGHICNECYHLIDVCIQLINGDTNLCKRIGGDLSDQLVAVCIDQSDQLCRSSAVLVEVVISKVNVHPSGQINIYNAEEITCSEVAEVSGNASGNDGVIGIHYAAVYVNGNVCLILATKLTAGDLDRGISGLDYQNSRIRTNSGDIAVVKSGVDQNHSVNTCVSRSNSAIVLYPIGLHTDVTDLNTVSNMTVNGNKQLHSGVVEGEDEDVICVAVLINNLYVAHLGSDYDVTDVVRGRIVGVNGNCCLEIYTNLGGILSANSDLNGIEINNLIDHLFVGIDRSHQSIENVNGHIEPFKYFLNFFNNVKQFSNRYD